MEGSEERLWVSLESYSKMKLLQELADIKGLENKPLVTLLLTSGQALTGQIIKYTDGASGTSVLIRLDFNSQWMPVSQLDLFYVEPHLIAGITVHDARRHVRTLAKTMPRQVTGEDKVTNLMLKRLSQGVLSEIRKITGNNALDMAIPWDAFPDTEGTRLNLRDLIEALKYSIAKSCEDDLGEEAWKSLTGVVIRQVAGQEIRCSREGTTIVLSADWTLYLPADLEDWLHQKMNRVL